MKVFGKMLLLSALTVVLFLLPACSKSAPAPQEVTEQPPVAAESAAEDTGEAAQANAIGTFSTKDTAGNVVTEAVFQDADVTMLNVWATFCGYCIEEMPELTALNQEFADRGFQIIGLVGDVGDYKGGFTEADMATAANILDKAGADFPTLMPGKELIDSVLSRVTAYPTTFFVDHAGNLLGTPVRGAMGEDFWRGAIEAYLEAAPKREAQP